MSYGIKIKLKGVGVEVKIKFKWQKYWIIGIYIILFIILYLTIQYKVKWENKDLNTYLYFYNCSGNICTTSNQVTNYYGKVKCEETCPHITERNGDYVILASADKEILFNYKKDEIINDYYSKFSFMNDYLLARNADGKYGIIDYDNNIQVPFEYNKIVDYKDGYLAYSENDKIGITNKDLNITIKPQYQNVQLINDSIFTYVEDNKYYIASYDTELPINSNHYDYVYGKDYTILLIKDKKLDIVDSNLNSKLLLKINTYYKYSTEKERESLNIQIEGNILRFTIDGTESSTNYIYDIKNKKLLS